MTGISNNMQVRMRKRLMQLPGIFHRTYYIITPVYYHCPDFFQNSGIIKKIIVFGEKALIGEIVTLDTCKSIGELIVSEFANRSRVEQQFGR